MSDVIDALTRVLQARRNADPETSYVAQLYGKGLDKILEKVGEEATEVLIAAKNVENAIGRDDDPATQAQALTGEVADLWFHTMVMMVQLDIEPKSVLAELEGRFGLPGLEEKANRAP